MVRYPAKYEGDLLKAWGIIVYTLLGKIHAHESVLEHVVATEMETIHV